MRQYAEIRRVMDSIGMRDLWAWDVYRHNPSEGHTCRYTDGDDRSSWERVFEPGATGNSANVCLPLMQSDPSAQSQPYCDDRAFHPPPHSGVRRYDYVFIERPAASHRYTLEASRILRRPFPLIGREFDGEKYLSDHIALEVTFFGAPKR